MDDSIKIILTRNKNSGGVLTIINQIKAKYPNIEHLSLDDGIIAKLRLLVLLSKRNAVINIHGWIGLKILLILKRIGYVRCRLIFSLHSDPIKELKNNLYKFNILIKISEKLTFVSEYHLKNVLINCDLSKNEIDFLLKNSEIIYYKQIIEENEFYQNRFRLVEKRIGLITRLSEEKGVDFVCHSLADSYKISIWGEGPLKQELEIKYPNVVFRGLSLNYKYSLREIDIFIFTSNWGVWGISLLEAISIGKRFVYPRNENWKEIFPEEAYILSYENKNPSSLNEAIKNCIQLNEEDFLRIAHKILEFPKENHVDIYARL